MYADSQPQYALPRWTTRRVAAGIALSLAAHALLLFSMRHGLTGRYQAPSPPQRMMVWLRPVPPPPPREVKPPPQERPAQAAHTPTPRAVRPPAPHAESTPTPVIALTPDSPAAAPDGLTVPPQPATPPGPAFDQEAAKAAARRIASEEAAAHPEVNSQISAETKLARSIARAKRPDCKDGIPGGLLAPIYLLLEKKDHGCKW